MYGITLEQFTTMREQQGGMCLICHKFMDKPHVDHCHATGKVRGLLCGNCNRGLGVFFENIQTLENAISYLKARG